MSGLSAAKAQAVDRLIQSLPDHALGVLREALTSETSGSWSDPVRASADRETADRRLRDNVLQELVAMSRTSTDARPDYSVSSAASGIVWYGVKAIAPEKVRFATERQAGRDHERLERVSLQLLSAAGVALDGAAGPFALIAERLGSEPGGAERITRIVRLSPLVRACVPRARAWFKTGDREEAYALRLALQDASALCDEGGPLFIDILAAQFQGRWTSLRLVSAVMDRPKEAFLAASEVSGVAEAALETVDAALASLGRFDGAGGRDAGSAAAAATELVIDGLAELGHWVQLDAQQPWGRRVAMQRRSVSRAVQARLKEADGVVARALPVQPVRAGGKILRGDPDLDAPVDPMVVRRAEASLTYVGETRRAALSGGFSSLRAKVVEALDARVATYADDLFELVRGQDPAVAAEARARLPMVADFLGMVREPAAGQMLRRRLAAA